MCSAALISQRQCTSTFRGGRESSRGDGRGQNSLAIKVTEVRHIFASVPSSGDCLSVTNVDALTRPQPFYGFPSRQASCYVNTEVKAVADDRFIRH